MAYLELPVRSDFKAYSFQVDLEGTTYGLNFRFNTRTQNWEMDIRDSLGNDLLTGIVLLTNVLLTRQYVREDLPPGQFLCVDESGQDKDPGSEGLGNDVKLLYEESA